MSFGPQGEKGLHFSGFVFESLYFWRHNCIILLMRQLTAVRF